ncbi:L-threonylcarbamoyladenylate synthase [Desulfomarina sp.]
MSAIFDRAVNIIQEGGIVAFPTETSFGLAVDYENEKALEKLYRIKQRSHEKALLVLVENRDQLSELVTYVPAEYRKLMDKFWPGPLTLIFPARKELSTVLTGGSGTIGIRISPHPLATRLVSCYGKPLTATSANLSGNPPAKSAEEIRRIFKERVDFIIEEERVLSGNCSTIVGIQNRKLKIFRNGVLDMTLDDLIP